MTRLFDLSTSATLPWLLLAVAAMCGWLIVLWFRSPLIVRIGSRAVLRRRMRAGLVVMGLALSTTVIGSALGTGDAMSYTVRSVVTESLGSVDEVVVLGDRRQRRAEDLRTLTQPGLASIAAAEPSLYPAASVAAIASSVKESAAIAALSPALIDQVAVLHGGSTQLRSAMLVLAIPPGYPSEFGALTDTEGAPFDLTHVEADEIVVNEAAARELEVLEGQQLSLLPGTTAWQGRASGEPWNVSVAAIVRDGGISGSQPAMILPLARYQAATQREGYINVLLVANHGGVTSVENTDQALEELRGPLVNVEAAQQLHALLRDSDAQQGMLEAATRLEDDDRERVVALRAEAARDEVSPRFISLISDPRVRGGLYFLARDYLAPSQRSEARRLLHDVTDLAVLPIKQQGVSQADEYGSVVTAVFLVLGIFSIGASILLVFLTFSLLASDRVTELATIRAIGMTNRQVMGIFLVEGLIYAVAGAVLGTLAGMLTARLTTISIARALDPFGFDLQPHLDLTTLLVSFCVGLLLTFAAVTFSAWRASRTEIVAATHGEEHDDSVGWRFVSGAALLAIALFVWLRWHEPALLFEPRHPLVVPVTAMLAVVGVAVLVAGGLRRSRMATETVTVLTGGIVALIWLRALSGLPTARGEVRDDAFLIAVGGICLVAATILTTARSLGPLLRNLDRALSAVGRLRAVVRPAGGQIAWQRSRTAMVVVMFGMVIFVMTISLTMIDALLRAYADNEAPVAGFELRAEARGNLEIDELPTLLSESDAIAQGTFVALGGLAAMDVQIVDLSLHTSSWRGATLVAADDGFVGAIAVKMHQSSPEYSNVRDVWDALSRSPGTAVVTADLFASGSGRSRLNDGSTLDPTTIWARPDVDDPSVGVPVELTVIGVIDSRSELASGIYTSRETASSLRIPIPARDTWYLALSPGSSLADTEEGLRVALADHGMLVVNLGDTLRISQSIRTLLTRLVQGFMGIGLVAGIAALGLLGVQSVIERRQQLGTLRALGFTGRQTGATLAIESAVVALAGILLGVLLGLYLARVFITLLGADHPEIRFAVPSQQIAVTVGLAWFGSALSIALAAWQASRVSPSAALRTA